MTTIDGAVVLVTGANGGLGIEFVSQALDRGASKVYASARTPREWADPRVVPISLDVTSEQSIADAAAATSDTTILINNAGVNSATPLLDSSLDQVREIFDINVLGPLSMVQHFAPVLAANGGGAIIDIHSARSWLSGPGAYSSSKAAFWALTNSLRLELEEQNTHVLGAHFAFADTPMTSRFVGVDKSDPATIVEAIYDGLEAGQIEVIADELTHRYKSGLSLPLSEQYPQFS